MEPLRWWMRITGLFYVLQATIAGVVRLPIRVLGPVGTLDQAAAGDPVAALLVDTWVLFGLEIAVVGVALHLAARTPERGRPLVWLVLGLELFRGVAHDVYMIGRGHPPTVFLVWIAIHTVIIGTGLLALRRARSVQS